MEEDQRRARLELLKLINQQFLSHTCTLSQRTRRAELKKILELRKKKAKAKAKKKPKKKKNNKKAKKKKKKEKEEEEEEESDVRQQKYTKVSCKGGCRSVGDEDIGVAEQQCTTDTASPSKISLS
uniref:Uncharacterized protein n=1 Tax=Oryza meridionalis TaxID=40149 RepID=A0A0E0F2S3_9ORYZ